MWDFIYSGFRFDNLDSYAFNTGYISNVSLYLTWILQWLLLLLLLLIITTLNTAIGFCWRCWCIAATSWTATWSFLLFFFFFNSESKKFIKINRNKILSVAHIQHLYTSLLILDRLTSIAIYRGTYKQTIINRNKIKKTTYKKLIFFL